MPILFSTLHQIAQCKLVVGPFQPGRHSSELNTLKSLEPCLSTVLMMKKSQSNLREGIVPPLNLKFNSGPSRIFLTIVHRLSSKVPLIRFFFAPQDRIRVVHFGYLRSIKRIPFPFERGYPVEMAGSEYYPLSGTRVGQKKGLSKERLFLVEMAGIEPASERLDPRKSTSVDG